MTLTAETICRNPFRLGLPDSETPIRAEISAQAAKLLAQWQGTIAATMQRQAQEEGHRGLLPHTAPIGVRPDNERRATIEAAIIAVLEQEPLSTAGIAIRANLNDSVVAYALSRMRKAGRVTLTGSGHYAKWQVGISPTAVRIMDLLQTRPRSPLKYIAETLLLSPEHTRLVLIGLCENGKIIAEREPVKPRGHRNVFSVKS